MKKNVKYLSFFLCIVLIASSCLVPSFAKIAASESTTAVAEENETESNAEETDITVKPCANKGDWSNLPENSVEAVVSSPCEYVSVDVKITSDGIPVLMEDDTVDRTCVDKNGKAVKGNVSDYKYEEISKLFLRNRNGGPHNKKTDIKVPNLEQVISKADGKTLILDFKLSDFETVYKAVELLSAQTKVIFRIDGKADDIIYALASKDKVPETILKYDGSIIFGVNKTIKRAAESGLHMVQIGSKNQYGVIFYNSVENRIRNSKLKAVFSMTDGYNAKRSDNFTGWDDVISHGYSIIETDYPDLFTAYVQSSDNVRAKLNELMAEKVGYENGKYPQNLMEEYTNAYAEAEAVINKASSQSQLANALTRLESAGNALNISEGTSTQQTVLKFSVGRIITAVLCLAAVIAAQVFFYKRRKNK